MLKFTEYLVECVKKTGKVSSNTSEFIAAANLKQESIEMKDGRRVIFNLTVRVGLFGNSFDCLELRIDPKEGNPKSSILMGTFKGDKDK